MKRSFEPIWLALPFPAFVIAAEGVIAEVNDAAEGFCMASRKQMLGRLLVHFAGVGSAVEDAVAQAQGGMRSVVLHDVKVGWGGQARGLANVQVTRLGEGEVLLMMHPRSIADKMDRSLLHRNAARSVAGMAAMLAHEIRNPLAGISGAAQLLRGGLSAEDQELTAVIEDEAKRIGDLVNRVEAFGEMGPGVIEPVNIHDIIDRAKRAAAAGFAAHMHFKDAFDPSIPPTAGSADQLLQVIINLLKNAAEASPNSGVITIKTTFRPGVKLSLPGKRSQSLPIEISVRDNGPGIALSILDDVFEPFVSTKASGTGLGLALVSKIMADHGGVVDCKTDANGTEFRLLLPVWKGEEH
ncbi:MAG: PAS domain-containing sensor histidine kinase [Rhodobacteraceae bacterium]|nr:PAS domain-containing sensor histidine kinase [Paracoccaceae bacterium]